VYIDKDEMASSDPSTRSPDASSLLHSPTPNSDEKKSSIPDCDGKAAAPAKDDEDSGDLTAMRARELINPDILPRLDPEFVRFYINELSMHPTLETFSVEDVRAHPEWFRSPSSSALAASAAASGKTQDYKIVSEDGTEFAVRVYRPDAATHGAGPWPVHVNFHGEYIFLFLSLLVFFFPPHSQIVIVRVVTEGIH